MTTPEWDPTEALDRLVAEVQNADNAAEGFVMATTLSQAIRGVQSRNKELRVAYARELWVTYSLDEIAELIGVTRSAIEQIIKGKRS